MAITETKGYDRRVTNVRLVVEGIANDVPTDVTPVEGMQYIVGAEPAEDGAFKDAHPNQIAEYLDNGWVFTTPMPWHIEIFDKSDNGLKRFNGTNFETVATLATLSEVQAAYTGKHETHILTAAEITAKKFDLENAVANDAEAASWLRWQSVDQIYGVDYTIVASSVEGKDAISWDGLGLDDNKLRVGDILKIQYEIEVPAAD